MASDLLRSIEDPLTMSAQRAFSWTVGLSCDVRQERTSNARLLSKSFCRERKKEKERGLYCNRDGSFVENGEKFIQIQEHLKDAIRMDKIVLISRSILVYVVIFACNIYMYMYRGGRRLNQGRLNTMYVHTDPCADVHTYSTQGSTCTL